MKKFADRTRPDGGFTVIELIAALSVFALVVGLVSTVTMMGFRNYDKITTENSLRTEGDIVMSSIMTELYTFGPDTITNIEDGIVLTRVSGSTEEKREIRIVDGGLAIGEYGKEAEAGAGTETGAQADDPRTAQGFSLNDSVIQSRSADGRLCERSAGCDSGLIHIQLKLQSNHDDAPYKLELESKFGF